MLVATACGSAAPSATPAATPTSPPPATPAPATTAPSIAPTAPPTAAPTFPIALTDDEGTVVELAARPETIVSLTPATTEILFAIGAGSRVAATTDFDDYPPEAVPLPDVASFTGVDVEAIVALEADLVIAGGNGFNDPTALERLRELGIPVLVTYAPTLDAVLADIELVGAAVGEPGPAAALVESLRADVEAVRTATADLPRPRVFYELDASNDIYGPADDSFLAEMLVLAGGEPITTGSATVFSIPLERLVAADPEVILLGDAAYGVTVEQVAARTGWAGMTAVQTGAIRPVEDVIITRPGPRIAEGLRALATAIHPDLLIAPPVR